MNIVFQPLHSDHRIPVMEIFNHYTADSFAAFPSKPLPEPFFDRIVEKIHGYPAYAILDGKTVAGFCFLSPYSPLDTFQETALITYFIAEAYTGRGLGTLALERLLADARIRGIRHILAEVASKNAASIVFHRKHGFELCGTLHGIGRKHGENFDVVLMQKELQPA